MRTSSENLRGRVSQSCQNIFSLKTERFCCRLKCMSGEFVFLISGKYFRQASAQVNQGLCHMGKQQEGPTGQAGSAASPPTPMCTSGFPKPPAPTPLCPSSSQQPVGRFRMSAQRFSCRSSRTRTIDGQEVTLPSRGPAVGPGVAPHVCAARMIWGDGPAQPGPERIVLLN